MNPNTKGSLGEYSVIKHLLLESIPVYKSVCDNSRVDLIAEVKDRLVRVQVKATSSKDGKAILHLVKKCLNSKYNYVYEKGDVDVFALYVDDLDKVFFVASDEALEKRTGITLRLARPKNNQTKNINLAEDYTDFKKALTRQFEGDRL